MTNEEIYLELTSKPGLLFKIGATFSIGQSVGIMIGLGCSEKEVREVFEDALKNSLQSLENEKKIGDSK